MTLVLSNKAVKLLSGDVGEQFTDCWSIKQDLCSCLDAIGITSLNLAMDEEHKPRYMHIERHFSRTEMESTQKKYGYYKDGKEVIYIKQISH